jgi:FkbM family methyltransferase
MLIPLSELVDKYDLRIENILHIGAHNCQELEDYIKFGAKYIHWVEANKKIYRKQKRALDKGTNQISCAVISDTDGEKVSFNITSSSQASSILKLKEHLKVHPDIRELKSEKRKTITIDTLMLKSNLGNKDIDFLNLDIQGAELLALKGAKKTLARVKTIFTEINEAELYEDCALIDEIDNFLKSFGFRRVEKKMFENCGWGDAFYIK